MFCSCVGIKECEASLIDDYHCPNCERRSHGQLKCKFLARDVIYTSRTYAMMSVSVCLSICDVCALWSQGAMDPGYLCYLLTTPHPDRWMG